MSDLNHQDFGPHCEINMPRPPRPHQLPTTEWRRPVQPTENDFDWLACIVISSACAATILGFLLPL